VDVPLLVTGEMIYEVNQCSTRINCRCIHGADSLALDARVMGWWSAETIERYLICPTVEDFKPKVRVRCRQELGFCLTNETLKVSSNILRRD
jgi:hypothetical protein